MIIIKYGGSILNPDGFYSEKAIEELINLLKKNTQEKFCFIIGGGKICRQLQEQSKKILEEVIPKEQMINALDEIGIATTKINAQYLLRKLQQEFPGEVCDEIIIDSQTKPEEGYRIYLAAGVRPGHSTDYDTLKITELFEAEKTIKISDFPIVLNVKSTEFDKEKIDTYEQVSRITWEKMQELVGHSWKAGASYPLGPQAAILGFNLSHRECGLKLLIGEYSQLEKMVSGEEFFGTMVE